MRIAGFYGARLDFLMDRSLRVLVAYDGTPGAETALLDLLRSGLPKSISVRVLAIADVWVPPDPAKDEPQFPEELARSRVRARAQALAAVENARSIATEGARRAKDILPEADVDAIAHADSPGWGILAEATRWNADLVVIGSHGRSTLEKFFLGSVSFKVAAEAHCSVRVVRGHGLGETRPRRVAIAVDGSEDSAAAVDAVLAREWPVGTAFELVTVLDPSTQSRLAWLRDFAPGRPVSEAPERTAEAVLKTHHARFANAGLAAEPVVLEGDPKRSLLHHLSQRDLDCVFLGARGLDHGRRLYLGTLASAVLTRAACTVEIVRPAPSL